MESESVLSRLKTGEGHYSNYFKIGFNAFEFLLDFGQAYVESDDDAVHTRIITTPPYARALAELLLRTLNEYESDYGHIRRSAEVEAGKGESGT